MGKGKGISLLVPFREDSSGSRTAPFEWLRAYYRKHLPDAETVIGECAGEPYSKSVALNAAAKLAHGDIYVLLDADTWSSPVAIERCADEIRGTKMPLWFMPHHVAYRLKRKLSDAILKKDPATYKFNVFPAADQLEARCPGAHGFCQIISAAGWRKVGGYDERYRGWGAEDGSFIRAADTLYGQHTRTRDVVISLWHDRPGMGSKMRRHWDDGVHFKKNSVSQKLASMYLAADGDARAMRKLVDAGLNFDEREWLSPSTPDSSNILRWCGATHSTSDRTYVCALSRGHTGRHSDSEGTAQW